MRLTKEEMDYVKEFIIEKKYIYVEEQVEILDHFISLLEDSKIEQNEEFGAFVDSVYRENKLELLSIQDSVKKSLKKQYNKIFLRNIRAHFTLKYVLIFLLGGALYFWYLISIENHITILTVSIPFIILLPLCVVDCRRKFAAARGKFFTNKIAAKYLIWWTGFQLLPCNILISLGHNGTINTHVSFILISLVFMIQLFMFRAFIQMILTGAKNCKIMEDNYRLTNA